jgi:hypothetical protein
MRVSLRASLLFSFTILAVSAAWLNFSGYEACAINLLETSVSIGSSVELDKVFELIKDATEEVTWTVYRREPFTSNPTDIGNYGENCAINVVVGVECDDRNFPGYFGNRFNTQSSIFIALAYSRPGCENKGGFTRGLPLVTKTAGSVHFLILDKDTDKIMEVHTICPTCWQDEFDIGSWVSLTLPVSSLLELSDRSKYINRHYHRAPASVFPGYRALLSQSSEKCNDLHPKGISRSCTSGLIFTNNLAQKMNFTIELNTLFNAVVGSHSVAVILLEDIELWKDMVLPFTRRSFQLRLAYCVASDTRELYHISFWAAPFDLPTWILVLLMCGLLTVIYEGNWFLVLGILMRQGQKLVGKGRLQVFCLFVTIVIGALYESCLSGYQTAPSPVARIETFKELIQHSYKILLGLEESMDLKYYYLTYTNLFKRSKIQERLNSSIFEYNTVTSSKSYMHLLSFCNTTSPIEPSVELEDKFVLAPRLRRTYGVSCHLVKDKDASISKTNYYFFLKHLAPGLLTQTQRFSESGVLNWIYSFAEDVVKHDHVIQVYRSIRNENQPTAFVMRDWKIKSIFYALCILLLLAGCVFGTELTIIKCLSFTSFVFSRVKSYT